MDYEQIGVDCQFSASGRIRVRRIQRDKKWIPVGQGRQWVDQLGRHVLVMTPHDQVLELVQQPDTMRWVIWPRNSRPKMV